MKVMTVKDYNRQAKTSFMKFYTLNGYPRKRGWVTIKGKGKLIGFSLSKPKN